MWSSRGAVERHVVKRFEAWYGSGEILHHAIGRLVRRINTILLTGIASKAILYITQERWILLPEDSGLGA